MASASRPHLCQWSKGKRRSHCELETLRASSSADRYQSLELSPSSLCVTPSALGLSASPSDRRGSGLELVGHLLPVESALMVSLLLINRSSLLITIYRCIDHLSLFSGFPLGKLTCRWGLRQQNVLKLKGSFVKMIMIYIYIYIFGLSPRPAGAVEVLEDCTVEARSFASARFCAVIGSLLTTIQNGTVILYWLPIKVSSRTGSSQLLRRS